MYRFEHLEIWKLSVEFSKKIYKTTSQFPKDEIFGLTSQIRRAVISISSNIAEGCGSATTKDFQNFLDIAIKSTYETASQLLITKELGLVSNDQFNELYEISEILVKKIRSFKAALKTQSSRLYAQSNI